MSRPTEFPCYLAEHSTERDGLGQSVYVVCWPTVPTAQAQLENAWFGLIGHRMAMAADRPHVTGPDNWISSAASALWVPGATQATAETTLAKLISRAPLNFSIATGESRFRPNHLNVLFKDFFDVAWFESSRRGRTLASHVYVTTTRHDDDALLAKAIRKSASFLTQGCRMTEPEVSFVAATRVSLMLQLARVAAAAAARHVAGVDPANLVFQSVETKLSSLDGTIPRGTRRGR